MPDDLMRLAERLTEAQRRYLLALEPNRIDEGTAGWIREVEREFQNRSHRKPLKGPGLASAAVLVRKGIVKRVPEPVECGWHYASLTPLGEQVTAALRAKEQTK